MPNPTSQAREAAEIVIGLGVIGFQRAQVQKQHLMKMMQGPRGDAERAVGDLRNKIGKGFVEADRKISPILGRVESELTHLERAVPDAGREAVRRSAAQVRHTAQDLKDRFLRNP